MLNEERVAEIWVPASKERGTGYLLCNGCLLTAHHVIEGHDSGLIDFRLMEDYEQDRNHWTSAKVIWKNPGVTTQAVVQAK